MAIAGTTDRLSICSKLSRAGLRIKKTKIVVRNNADFAALILIDFQKFDFFSLK